MKNFTLSLVFVLFCFSGRPQSVGIGKTEFTPVSSAALEIRSVEKGVLIPKMLESERNAIVNPAVGLLVFQTDNPSGFYYYNGTQWQGLTSDFTEADGDVTNEIQVLSISNDTIFLSKSGGFVKLPFGSMGAQSLSLTATNLSISGGNTVDLSGLKDNMGNHVLSQNLLLQNNYLSNDGDQEGIRVNNEGDVTLSRNLTVVGDAILKPGSINSQELEDGAVTTDKIGDGQVTASKLSGMNASTDSYLKWNGSIWIPSSIGGAVNYRGVWSAQSNQPLLVNGTGTRGDFYIVSSNGTQDLGSGSVSFYPGDWLFYNGLVWERVNNSNEVNTVFGRKGMVTAQSGDYNWAQIDKSTSFLSDLSQVLTSNPNSGNVLLGNGTHWVSKTIKGDLEVDSEGNTSLKDKVVSYDKLQDATGPTGTILQWNGNRWSELDVSSLVQDELQDVSLDVNNNLSLTKSTVSVDLTKYLDNTDRQDLSLNGNLLELSNDPTKVDLSSFKDNTDNQNLDLQGTVLSIEGGNSVDFISLASIVRQDLELSGNTLSLTEDATPVDLSKYLDNTDQQQLNLSSDQLSITNGGAPVNLSMYKDNTDSQELSLSGNILSISGGIQAVDLSGLITNDNQDLSLSGDNLELTNDITPVNLSAYKQNLSLSGTTIDISNGTGVDISSLFQLGLSGENLEITGSATGVNLGILKDNLGNHVASQKLQLGTNKIGYGTEDNGLSFASNGNATFTGEIESGKITAVDIELGNGSINTNELADGSVNLAKIQPLNSGQIIMGTTAGNAAITVSGDVQINNVGVIELQDDVVTTSKILNGTVIEEDIADGSVSGIKLAENSVTNEKIVNGTIQGIKLEDGTIESAKLSQMSASNGQFLGWDGSKWTPQTIDIDGTLDYQGTWNASTNTPSLSNGTGVKGDFYVVSVDGTVNLGSGNVDYYEGDWIFKNDTEWERVHNSTTVTSVHGRFGDVVSATGDYTWNQIDKAVSSINDIADVNSTSVASGNILISDGLHWNNRNITGDASLNSSGQFSIGNSKVVNSKIAENAVSYSKLQDATGAVNTILVWNGSSWVESLFNSLEVDGSITNELQSLSLTGDDLSLSKESSTVNLSKYLDNTDSQFLSLVGTQLSISGGNNIDLSGFASTDSQELGLTGNTLSLTRSATSVDLSAYSQDLGLNTTSNILSITGGNAVDLSVYKDNTDNQDLVLTGDVLSLTNDATTLDLSKYLDNTDTQTLSIAGHNLSITGGNTLDISSADSQDLSLAGDVLSLTNDATTVDISAYRQSLSLNANNLSITNGNVVDLSSVNTDAQSLSLTGTSLSISGGNTQDLSGLQDNLGNHTATQNISIAANWLSNDGTNNGISIDGSGNVTANRQLRANGKITGDTDLSVGGNLSVGKATAITSAIVDIESSDKGILIPRMSTTQRDLIVSPATGLMIYNTTENAYNFYNGTLWTEIGGNDNLGNHNASANLQLNGNYIGNDGDNEGLRVDNSGNISASGNVSVSGSLVVGDVAAEATALLDLESTSKGFLPPRMTTTQREAISSPAKGLLVFDTSVNSLFTYNGTAWVSAEASANTWNVSGNTTIDETTNFIGSVNAADVVVKTQNTEVMRVTKDSHVGIGTGATIESSAKLEVNSNDKGFLPPRMTTAQRNAIVNPAIGLVVFDTNKNNLYMFTGIWTEIGVPIGSIQAFMGTTVPDGWLLCDGSSFTGADYPELQTILGGTNLPDLRAVFLRGLDNGRGLDTGRTLGSYQEDELKSHEHYMWHTLSGWNNAYGDPNAGAIGMLNNYGGGGVWMYTHPNTQATGGAETRPKNVAVNYIIRAR